MFKNLYKVKPSDPRSGNKLIILFKQSMGNELVTGIREDGRIVQVNVDELESVGVSLEEAKNFARNMAQVVDDIYECVEFCEKILHSSFYLYDIYKTYKMYQILKSKNGISIESIKDLVEILDIQNSPQLANELEYNCSILEPFLRQEEEKVKVPRFLREEPLPHRDQPGLIEE